MKKNLRSRLPVRYNLKGKKDIKKCEYFVSGGSTNSDEDVSTRADHEPADQTQDWSKERIGFELILRKRISNPTIIIVLLLLLLQYCCYFSFCYRRLSTTMWPGCRFRRCWCATPCRYETVRTIHNIIIIIITMSADRSLTK